MRPLQMQWTTLPALPRGSDPRAMRRWLRDLIPRDPDRERPAYDYLLGASAAPQTEDAMRRELLWFLLSEDNRAVTAETARDSIARARAVATRLHGWIGELRSPDTTLDRRSDIEKEIDQLYNALASGRGASLMRIELAEALRFAACFRIAEVLGRMAERRPEGAPAMKRFLGAWLHPASLASSLVSVRWPTLAEQLNAAERDTNIVTEIVMEWRTVTRGRVADATLARLSELFERVNLRCDWRSFGAEYRRWHKDRGDEYQERLQLWGRLSVILEDVGFCDGNVAGDLEEIWQTLIRDAPRTRRNRP